MNERQSLAKTKPRSHQLRSISLTGQAVHMSRAGPSSLSLVLAKVVQSIGLGPCALFWFHGSMPTYRDPGHQAGVDHADGGF